MNNRERSAKKRKREVKNSHTGPGTDHKSPFGPFRVTERVGKSREQHELTNRSKPSKPNSKGRKKPVNWELTEVEEEEVTDDSEVTDDATPSTTRNFSDLDIAPGIQRAIASIGLSELKEIQRNLIPSILARKDVSSSPIVTRFTHHQILTCQLTGHSDI